MNDVPEQKAECVTIKVSGDFSFALGDTFKEILASYPAGEHCFAVDMSEVEELDASALTMLLQLREHSRKDERVRLLNPSPVILTKLRQAKYPGWFDIVQT